MNLYAALCRSLCVDNRKALVVFAGLLFVMTMLYLTWPSVVVNYMTLVASNEMVYLPKENGWASISVISIEPATLEQVLCGYRIAKAVKIARFRFTIDNRKPKLASMHVDGIIIYTIWYGIDFLPDHIQ
ncbi:MAG: hypothetical protein SFX18_12230 [Pirellulales bacterium]|nr:hypothetical protein [Pirellulales bacterium]